VHAPHRDPPLKHTPIYWDILIAICVIVPGILSYGALSYVPAPWSLICAVLLWISIALVVYGSFIESRIITVNKKSIHISSLPDITIAVVADFHVGPYKGRKFVQRAVQKIMALKPDIIVIPGDFIFDHHADASHLKPLKKLRAPLGVFAVMGNHDSGHHLMRYLLKPEEPYQTVDRADEISNLLESLGISVLRNSAKIISKDGKKFALVGIDDLWMEECDIDSAFKKADKTPSILLAHNPDMILEPQYKRASLIISGHTHGGQVRLPFIGALTRVPDKLGNKYDQGIFTLKNGTVLAITHGIGETMGRMRFCCPPEILLLTNSR